MMELIDYDSLFNDYLNKWLKENRSKYKKPEQLEEAIEDVYFHWLEQYKDSFSGFGGKQLMEYLIGYSESGISVPDILCDAITEKKDETEELLFKWLETGELNIEAQMLAINLLMQMQSTMGVDMYIGHINSGDEEDELAEVSTEALINMEEYPRSRVIDAYRKAQSTAARDRLAEIMSYYTSDDEVFGILADLFVEKPAAMTAVWLARLNDPRAIELFKSALAAPDIDYLDYLEIKNSLESLGEEVTVTRDFSGDESYEQIKDLGLDK